MFSLSREIGSVVNNAMCMLSVLSWSPYQYVLHLCLREKKCLGVSYTIAWLLHKDRNDPNRCLSILTKPNWHEGRGTSRFRSSTNTPFTFRKSWGFMFKQLCFTITHTEFLLCWHIWNYCTGSEPPRMTENRKIRAGSVKGDTLVTKLRRPVLAFEWTECQLQSPSVVTLNKNINSHSPHIKRTKSIWHLARTVWVVKFAWARGVNTYIYFFYVFNDVRALCLHTYVRVCVCAWREAVANESSCINHTEMLGSHSHHCLTTHTKLTVYWVHVNRLEVGHTALR